jgi:hypothetical protein
MNIYTAKMNNYAWLARLRTWRAEITPMPTPVKSLVEINRKFSSTKHPEIKKCRSLTRLAVHPVLRVFRSATAIPRWETLVRAPLVPVG